MEQLSSNFPSGAQKFGFLTDTHFDFKFACRKDDALETLIDKARQCYAWFRERGCSFVVHCGDVFDRHRIYNFDLIARVRRVFVESGLKTYYILGQHDLQGYNPKSLGQSNLGFVDAISDGALSLIEDEAEVGGYRFVASHVNIDPAERIDAIRGRGDGKPVVVLCHALLADQRDAFGTISIRHFKNPNVQLVLSGDLHDGVAFQEANGIQFYNPGSLCRDARTHRRPKAGALRWNGERFELEEFFPECPDAEEIFFWDDGADAVPKTAAVLREERPEAAGDKSFVEAFRDFRSEAKDIYELLEKIGRKNGVRAEILELIKRHKDKAEK